MRVPSLHSQYELAKSILGHQEAAYCVLFDKTGKRFITAADDRIIKLWSSQSGVLIATLRGHLV
jgi:bromodomain and WD repeat domain containing protein 1/3